MSIRIAPGAITPDRIVRSVCSPNCTGSCGINVHVKDGKMLKVEPADFPDPRYRRICLKGISMTMQRMDHEGRMGDLGANMGFLPTLGIHFMFEAME